MCLVRAYWPRMLNLILAMISKLLILRHLHTRKFLPVKKEYNFNGWPLMAES